jgi:hypothetical protein
LNLRRIRFISKNLKNNNGGENGRSRGFLTLVAFFVGFHIAASQNARQSGVTGADKSSAATRLQFQLAKLDLDDRLNKRPLTRSSSLTNRHPNPAMVNHCHR